MIYFIEAIENWTTTNTGAGLIKIGTTIRLSKRIEQIKSEIGSPVRILAVMDGSFADETVLHERFRSYRLVGEWFEPHTKLLEFIKTEGREWYGQDDVPDQKTGVIRMTNEVLEKAKKAAALMGLTVSTYVSNVLREEVDRDILREAKKLVGGSDS